MRKNIKRYAVIGLLILAVGIFVNAIVNKATAWHSADDIWVSIDSYEMTLQSAIDNNMFIGLPKISQPYNQSIPDPGHSANEIWVSVNGDEKTLQEAIFSPDGLCGSSTTTSYPNDINPGHLASEIEVSGSDRSFQDTIDTGELVSIDGNWSDWSTWSHINGYDDGVGGTCSASCNGTQTQTRTCTNPSPYCAGADCVGLSSQNQNCNVEDCTGKVCGGCEDSCGTCSGDTPYCNPAGTCVECNNDNDCSGSDVCSGGSCDANPRVCRDCSNFDYCWYTLVSSTPQRGSFFIKWEGVFIANQVRDARTTNYTKDGYYYERGSYIGGYSSTSFYGVCSTEL